MTAAKLAFLEKIEQRNQNTIQLEYELNTYNVCIRYVFGLKYKSKNAIHTNPNRENH